MTESVGIGVIGARSFVANAAVLPAIDAAHNAHVAATASAGGDVAERWRETEVESYDAVLEHPDVGAVYIPLPNGMHREWTERAAAAGKHVLCEKPVAAHAATARAMVDACERAGVLLAEAWMTPFHRRYHQIVHEGDLIHEVGPIERIDAAFSFTIGPGNEANYRWDPEQGGGALLDVGIYCLGAAVELFDAEPVSVWTTQTLTDRGVDASTTAELVWSGGRSASIHCSFIGEDAQTLHLSGPGGAIDINDRAFTGGESADRCTVTQHGEAATVTFEPNDPYQTMVEVFAESVAGRMEWPRPAERSIELLTLIERIRNAAAT